MSKVRYLISLIALAISGCATAPNWSHPSIPDAVAMKRQLTIDDGNCTLISMGAAPIPAVTASDTPKTTNFTMSGSSFNSATGARTYGTYTGQATTVPSGGFAGGFASGMASGASLGAALAARAAQDRIYTSCMLSKGWTDSNTAKESTQLEDKPQRLPATNSQSTARLQAPSVYSSDQIEWVEDVEEFLRFFPAYSTGENHKHLDKRVRLLANSEHLTGPQYLLKAAKGLAKEGIGAESGIDERTGSREMYLKAIEGDSVAQAGLGLAYAQENHPSIPLNEKRSAYWSRKAALQGSSAGQIGYGLMLFNGVAGTENKINGYLWVKKAENQGANVSGILKSFRERMTPAEIQSVGQ